MSTEAAVATTRTAGGRGRLRWVSALWLAMRGGRSDRVRITLTAAGAALGTVAVLAAATVLAIGPKDGPYTSNLLSEGGLRPGVATALLLLCVPTLAFVGQCVRIGAPARDRRLAAVRLAGGSPVDVSRIACGEAAVAAGIGALAGLGLYLAGRLLLDAPVPGTYAVTTTETFPDGGINMTLVQTNGLVRSLPTDVLPPWWVVLMLVAAVPLAAALGSGLALRRVVISPFGVSRRRPSHPPRVLPAVLFLLGVLGLAAFTTVTRWLGVDPGSAGGFAAVFFALFLLVSAGLVLGTAALASLVGAAVAGRTRRASLLIAGRRLAADPYSASRSFGALLLTVLVGAAAQGVRVSILVAVDQDDAFYRNALDLVDLVIVAAVLIAALGLLVVAAEGIVARRRALAALTAAGTPIGVLRRAVVAETLLPLLPIAPLAAIAGVLAARGLFGTTYEQSVSSSDGAIATRVIPIPVPWAQVSVLVVGTVLVALALTAVSLVFLRSSTDPAELRAAA